MYKPSVEYTSITALKEMLGSVTIAEIRQLECRDREPTVYGSLISSSPLPGYLKSLVFRVYQGRQRKNRTAYSLQEQQTVEVDGVNDFWSDLFEALFQVEMDRFFPPRQGYGKAEFGPGYVIFRPQLYESVFGQGKLFPTAEEVAN